MALTHITSPAQAQSLIAQGFNVYYYGNGQYYDPGSKPGPGKANVYTHVYTPAQAQQLADQGINVTTWAGGQWALAAQVPPGSVLEPAATPRPTGDVGIRAAAPGMTSTQRSAWQYLQAILASYGFSGGDLSALVAWAKGQIVAGNSTDMIQLNLEQTPQFEKRFPAIKTLAGQGVAITPAEYISLEQSYSQLLHQAGLPPNYASYDNLIAGQVSPNELSDRLRQGYTAVANADPTVIKAFQDYYHVGPSALAAYFLNPAKAEPLLLQQAVSAQIGGASAMSGFGEIPQHEALRLAQMNVTFAQAQQGFQKLAAEKQLYTNLPGQQAPILSQEQLLNAQFGSDAQALQQLQRQAEYEKGTTNIGTSVATTQAGATGIAQVQR
jgi:hypothetical protein